MLRELGGLDLAGGRSVTARRAEGAACGAAFRRSVAIEIGSGDYAFETEVPV